MRAKPHPEQGFRACLGILSLARGYGPVRLEAACRRGVSIGATQLPARSPRSSRTASTRPSSPMRAPAADPIRHGNIRGRGYYH